jgi:hypothetical protein
MCLAGEIAYDLANHELSDAIVHLSPRRISKVAAKIPHEHISRKKLLEAVAPWFLRARLALVCTCVAGTTFVELPCVT